MSESREKIFSELLNLIARKDPTVFQDPENFSHLMQKAGNWPELPEILALKAGLRERFPWELQKEPNGFVTAKTAQILTQNLQKKYEFDQELAYWALECWVKSLGLKLEKKVGLPPKVETQNPQPIQGEKAHTQPEKKVPNIAEPINGRIGLIFGLDEKGLVRVFKSWWAPAAESDSSKLIAVTIKSEPPKSRPLFSSSPKSLKEIKKNMVSQKPKAVIEKKSTPELQQKKLTEKKTIPEIPSQPVPNPFIDKACQKAHAFLPGGSEKVNIRQALKLLQEASNNGSMAARRKIAEIYLRGIGVKTNPEAASRWYLSAAENGDAEAQFQLGSLYQCGVGVPFSLEKAQTWLQKASEQGHIEAKELLNQLLQA